MKYILTTQSHTILFNSISEAAACAKSRGLPLTQISEIAVKPLKTLSEYLKEIQESLKGCVVIIGPDSQDSIDPLLKYPFKEEDIIIKMSKVSEDLVADLRTLGRTVFIYSHNISTHVSRHSDFHFMETSDGVYKETKNRMTGITGATFI